MKMQSIALIIISWSGNFMTFSGSDLIQVRVSRSSSTEMKRNVSAMKDCELTKAASLRDELRSTFDHLNSTGGLSGRPSGTDITDVVRKYINTDTSFFRAEEILKDAGFGISYPDLLNEPKNANKAVDWYAVVARISPYDHHNYSKASVFVTLLPERPGDYNKIAKVSAVIFATFL